MRFRGVVHALYDYAPAADQDDAAWQLQLFEGGLYLVLDPADAAAVRRFDGADYPEEDWLWCVAVDSYAEAALADVEGADLAAVLQRMDSLVGVAPRSYTEPFHDGLAEQARLIGDWAAQTDSELSGAVDEIVAILWPPAHLRNEHDWWLCSRGADGAVGLLPKTYTEPLDVQQTSAVISPHIVHEFDSSDAGSVRSQQSRQSRASPQRVPSPIRSIKSPPPVQPASPSVKSTVPLEYYPVTALLKSGKKQRNRPGFICVNPAEGSVSFVNDKHEPIQKWQCSQLTSHQRQKNTLTLELGALQFNFEFKKKKNVVAVMSTIDACLGMPRGTAAESIDSIANAASMQSIDNIAVEDEAASPPTPKAVSPPMAQPRPAPILPTRSTVVSTAPVLPVRSATTPVASPQPVLPTRSNVVSTVVSPPSTGDAGLRPDQPQPQGSQMATLLYDYSAQNDEELTVREADNVQILDSSDSEWWLVSSEDGKNGYVPAQYCSLVETGVARPTPSVPPAKPPRNRSPSPARLQSTVAASETAEKNPPPMPPRGTTEQKSVAAREVNVDAAPPPLAPRPAMAQDVAQPTVTATEIMRQWSDRSQSFTVNAVCMGVTAEGKIKLKKESGVTIAVPLLKMSEADLVYIEQSGDSNARQAVQTVRKEMQRLADEKQKAVKSSAVSAAKQPPRADSRPTPESASSQAAVRPVDSAPAKHVDSTAKSPVSVAVSMPVKQPEQVVKANSQFVINGFNWHDFFLTKSISAENASKYAVAFVHEGIEPDMLQGETFIGRDVLRGLGMREGDIFRIIGNRGSDSPRGSIGSTTSPSAASSLNVKNSPGKAADFRNTSFFEAPASAKVAKEPAKAVEKPAIKVPTEAEQKAEKKNLERLDSLLARKIQMSSSNDLPVNSEHVEQLKRDEEYARALQQNELAAAGLVPKQSVPTSPTKKSNNSNNKASADTKPASNNFASFSRPHANSTPPLPSAMPSTSSVLSTGSSTQNSSSRSKDTTFGTVGRRTRKPVGGVDPTVLAQASKAFTSSSENFDDIKFPPATTTEAPFSLSTAAPSGSQTMVASMSFDRSVFDGETSSSKKSDKPSTDTTMIASLSFDRSVFDDVDKQNPGGFSSALMSAPTSSASNKAQTQSTTGGLAAPLLPVPSYVVPLPVRVTDGSGPAPVSTQQAAFNQQPASFNQQSASNRLVSDFSPLPQQMIQSANATLPAQKMANNADISNSTSRKGSFGESNSRRPEFGTAVTNNSGSARPVSTYSNVPMQTQFASLSTNPATFLKQQSQPNFGVGAQQVAGPSDNSLHRNSIPQPQQQSILNNNFANPGSNAMSQMTGSGAIPSPGSGSMMSAYRPSGNTGNSMGTMNNNNNTGAMGSQSQLHGFNAGGQMMSQMQQPMQNSQRPVFQQQQQQQFQPAPINNQPAQNFQRAQQQNQPSFQNQTTTPVFQQQPAFVPTTGLQQQPSLQNQSFQNPKMAPNMQFNSNNNNMISTPQQGFSQQHQSQPFPSGVMQTPMQGFQQSQQFRPSTDSGMFQGNAGFPSSQPMQQSNNNNNGFGTVMPMQPLGFGQQMPQNFMAGAMPMRPAIATPMGGMPPMNNMMPMAGMMPMNGMLPMQQQQQQQWDPSRR